MKNGYLRLGTGRGLSYHCKLVMLFIIALRLTVKNPPVNAGDADLIPGLGSFPGEGNGNPTQYSCLGNPMDRGAWRATVHVITKSQTQMCTHAPACTNFF